MDRLPTQIRVEEDQTQNPPSLGKSARIFLHTAIYMSLQEDLARVEAHTIHPKVEK